jgi:coenzyme F420 hydrogenase subunit beta
MKSSIKLFIGNYLKVYIAWAQDRKLRYNSASGGIAITLLKYLLERGYVDAVIVPSPRFKHGLAYGVWTVIRESNALDSYSGSLYAPVYGLSKILEYALTRFKRIAITAVPCHTKAIKRLAEAWSRNDDIFVIGLYCNNTPSMWATKYVLKYFNFDMKDVKSVRFRGYGWPGYTVIETKKNAVYIPFSVFWDSGFGQYFYGLGCYLCNDQTNISADISLADPWTLPHEPIKRLGGATLVVVRSRKGLDVFESAIRAGYIKAVEIDPVYAIQSATIYRLTKKVLVRNNQDYLLPPSFSSISQELVYHIGRVLTSREKLWALLRLFHKTLARIIMFAASFLDYRLGTRWAYINRSIELLQKARSENVARLLKGLFKEDLEG